MHAGAYTLGGVFNCVQDMDQLSVVLMTGLCQFLYSSVVLSLFESKFAGQGWVECGVQRGPFLVVLVFREAVRAEMGGGMGSGGAGLSGEGAGDGAQGGFGEEAMPGGVVWNDSAERGVCFGNDTGQRQRSLQCLPCV